MTPPRRLSFSLKMKFVGVLATAIGIGWFASRLSWIRERQAVRDSGKIVGAWGGVSPPTAPGMLWLFGECGESGLILDADSGDPVLARAQVLFPEAMVRARDGSATQVDRP